MSLNLDDLRQDREHALLLSCCRARVRAADMADQRQLADGLDSGRFLDLVERHLVAPLVWHNLRQHPEGTFDPALMAALATRYRDNAFSELAVTGETLKLHRLLSESDIPHCVLKGLPVGQRYYGGAGLRQAGDIDLLVPPAMLDEACRLLSEAGYRISNPIDHLKPRQRSYFLFTDNQLELQAPGSGSVIELHWRPLQLPSSLAGLDLAAQTNRWDVAGCRIPFLDDEETLLHLCAHGAKHAWYRMKWVFDLPNVLESREWDWPALRAKAQRYRCERELLLGLAIAEQLSNWEVPPAVRPWLDEFDAGGKYFGFIAQAMTRPDRWMNTPAGIFGRNRYMARFNDGLDCWMYQLATIVTSRRDWELLPLPDALFPVYFLLSPFTNAWEIGRRFVRGLSGDGGGSGPAPGQPSSSGGAER
jgi:hypothetical protein